MKSGPRRDERGRLRLEDGAPPREPDHKLALGFSRKPGPRQVQAELRVQRAGSLAHMEAVKIEERALGETRIRVVPSIEVPSISALLDAATRPGAVGGKRFDPIMIGGSTSVRYGGTGTLGGFVQLETGKTGFVSNNHVLARLGSAKTEAQLGQDNGDRIYQPGRKDGDHTRNADCIGRVYDFIELQRDEANHMDVAVGLYDTARSIAGNVARKELGAPTDIALGQPRDILEMLEEVGEVQAAKVGRTTGFRTGEVTALDLEGIVVSTADGDRTFSGVTEVSSGAGNPFTRPGDSGSVVFDLDTGTPFGLHFAGGLTEDGSSYISLSCSLPKALAALNARWL